MYYDGLGCDKKLETIFKNNFGMNSLLKLQAVTYNDKS